MTAKMDTAGAIDMAMLRELGEWAALGLYEGLALPWPRAYGLALRRLYEQTAITIPADRCLFPHEPFERARTRPEHGVWSPKSLILDHHHHRGLQVNTDIAAEKQQQYPHYRAAIAALVEDLEQRLPHFGGYTHSNPDIRRVVNDGFLAMAAEVEAELAAVRQAGAPAEDEMLNFLLALQDYCAGVLTFHQRITRALHQAAAQAGGERQATLARMAESFAHGFLHPARTFLAGLQAVHFTWMLDGCDSIGRFDQTLGALYEQDVANGTLAPAFARQLLDELWQNFERFNGWNLQLGGYTPEGRDGANALTMECIAACRRNAVLRPNVALRLTKETPEDVLLAALDALRNGSGRPALYNDDAYLPALLDLELGLAPEDAREIGYGGCTETMIAGLSNVGSLEGEINLAKALELALHDGVDPQCGESRGPRTGRFADFATFAEFLAAVRRQIQFATEAFVAVQQQALRRRFHQGDPKLARSLFTRDCVKNRRSFEAGGARYNWTTVSYQGAANLIDSLAAIRQCVFAEGTVGKEELLAALRADFVGYDAVRQRLLAAPKFGNDDPAVDELGREIIGYAWEELLAHSCPRGGRFVPACILFVTYEGAGSTVGATPDGRQAYTVLTDSIGPAQGRDTHGPTAMLRSVLKLPLARAAGTPVLNLRLQQALFTTDEGLQAAAALVRAFFAAGGLQLQLSVVSKEAMLAAQQHPEQYRDLIVRMGGYSEYFVQLTRGLQDSVIARTEHGV